MALETLLDRLHREGWNRGTGCGSTPVPPSDGLKAADFREKSEGGTAGTGGTAKKKRAELKSAAVADEGALDHGDMAATIAEARGLAGITTTAKECAEDPRRCDCGGRCCWGFR